MEISTLQIIAIFLFSCIAGMGSVLDEFQTHRPLIACTVIGLILGDLKTGIMLGGTLELIALGWMNVGAAHLWHFRATFSAPCCSSLFSMQYVWQ